MKVSVIIPAYNHEEYIGAAIESVLNQTFGDFELIIINDGSIDKTEQVIQSYHDPKIRYFSQENQGAHNTINRGISLAKGDYISILNSDDVYHIERLEKCVHFLEANRDYPVVITLIEGIDSKGNFLERKSTQNIFSWSNEAKKISARLINKAPWISAALKTALRHFTWLNKILSDKTLRGSAWLNWYQDVLKIFEEKDFLLAAFTQNVLVTTSNYFMRKDVFQEVGIFRSLRYAHDWDMLLQLAQHYKIHLLKKCLLEYRVHEYNTIVESGSMVKTRFEVNWLIAENIRTLPSYFDIAGLIDALGLNRWISFEVLAMLLMMNDESQRNDLLDFSHPLTLKMLLKLTDLAKS